jgi:hypothetical protein
VIDSNTYLSSMGSTQLIDIFSQENNKTESEKSLEVRTKAKVLRQNKIAGKVFELMSTRVRKQGDYTEKDLHGISKRCDWFIDEVNLIKKKEIPKTIFLSSKSFLSFGFFVDKLLPTLKEDFVLVIGSEDSTFPSGDKECRKVYMTAENKKKYSKLMENKYLKCCFVENLDRTDKDLYPLPLGVLPYKDKIVPLGKVSFRNRSLKAMCIHRERMGPQWKDRHKVTKKCKNEWKNFVDYKKNCDRPEFLSLLKKYSFCVCVHGGGIDPSPKAWEALAMGCIPIIQHSTLDAAYSRFPVAFVDSWGKNSITKEKLKEWKSELGPRFTNPKLRAEVIKMLGVDYWWNIILSELQSEPKPESELEIIDRSKPLTLMRPHLEKLTDYKKKDLHGISKKCDWFITGLQLLKKKENPKTIFLDKKFPASFAFFVDEVLPELKEDFVLIIADEDCTGKKNHSTYMTTENIEKCPKLLENKHLKTCFVEGLDEPCEGLHPLPLKTLPYSESVLFEKVNFRNRLTKALCLFKEKIGPELKNHQEVRKKDKKAKEELVDYIETYSRPDFLSLLRKYSFCLCEPEKEGEIPTKVWEALAIGCIPIIKNSSFNGIYSGLPVVFVDSFGKKCITKEKLRKWRLRFEPRFLDSQERARVFEMLGVEYWWKIIQSKLGFESEILEKDGVAGKTFEFMSTRLEKLAEYTEENLHGISKRCDWFINNVQLLKKTKVPKTIFLTSRFPASFAFFVDDVLPTLKEDFVLIIADEDSTFPAGDKECRWKYMTPENIKRYPKLMENKYLKCCFVENLDRVNEGLYPLPLGILPYDKSIPLEKIEFKNRSLKALCIQRERGGAQWRERQEVTKKCKNEWEKIVAYKATCERPEFLNLLKKYSFCICVHGGGIDPSPKAWEALAMGCIPIIQHSTLDEAYSRFPVAFVDSWGKNSITKEKLQKWQSELGPRFTDPELRAEVIKMLGVDYWWKIILSKLETEKEKVPSST